MDSRHAVKVKPAECVDGLGLECEQEENNRDKRWSCHLLQWGDTTAGEAGFRGNIRLLA